MNLIESKSNVMMGKPVIGSEYAKEVKFFERIPEYSTSKTIESIVIGGNL